MARSSHNNNSPIYCNLVLSDKSDQAALPRLLILTPPKADASTKLTLGQAR